MRLLDNAALKYLKDNIEQNKEFYIKEEKVWINRFVNDIRLNIRNDLIISPDSNYDGENSIRLYENLSFISMSLASNDNFWTSLAHVNFYNYMKERWKVIDEIKTSFIESRYFYRASNQKSRARHGIARLWWIAHLTYDESNRSDSYYYTKVATKQQELMELIIETQHVSQNQKALFALLDTYEMVLTMQAEGTLGTFNMRNFLRKIIQQINLIGSITIWDLLTKEEAQKKLTKFVFDYFKLNIDKAVLAP